MNISHFFTEEINFTTFVITGGWILSIYLFREKEKYHIKSEEMLINRIRELKEEMGKDEKAYKERIDKLEDTQNKLLKRVKDLECSLKERDRQIDLFLIKGGKEE